MLYIFGIFCVKNVHLQQFTEFTVSLVGHKIVQLYKYPTDVRLDSVIKTLGFFSKIFFTDSSITINS